MKILGIDTSSPSGSVALLDNGIVISESLFNNSSFYSDKLLKEVDGVLNRSKTKLNELKCKFIVFDKVYIVNFDFI